MQHRPVELHIPPTPLTVAACTPLTPPPVPPEVLPADSSPAWRRTNSTAGPPDTLTLGSQLREVLRDELRRLSQGLREDVRAELQQTLKAPSGISRDASFATVKEPVGPGDDGERLDFRKVQPTPRSVRGYKCKRYAEHLKNYGTVDDLDALLSTPSQYLGAQRLSHSEIGVEAAQAAALGDEEEDLQEDPASSVAAARSSSKKPSSIPQADLPGFVTSPEQNGARSAARQGPLSRMLSTTFLASPEKERQPSGSLPPVCRDSNSSSQDSDVVGVTYSKSGAGATNEELKEQRSSRRSFAPLGGTSRKLDSADKAMALAPPKSKSKEFLDEHESLSRGQLLAQRIVKSTTFELFVMVMITASALHIGLQTDHNARHVLRSTPIAYRVIEVIFCVVFTLEILLRLVAFRRDFFRMYGWAWNLFDFTLVMFQLLEELLVAIAKDDSAQDVEAWNTGFLLRTARVLRAIRAIRVLHMARFTNELRLIMSCVVHSMKSFVWASALLLLMIYVVSIYLVQVVLVHRLDSANGSAELATWYGNVPRAVLSLFQGLTGGLDWDVLVAPLIDHVSPWLGVSFFLYTLFAIFAVMNVVTALFVESAIQRAAQVKEVQQVDQAMRLFKSLDMSHSGKITFKDLEDQLETREVLEFFRSIDVDVSEAKCLFDMLDVNDTGTIEFEEFLNGCMRLQGPAKAIDLVLVAREMRTNLEVNNVLLRKSHTHPLVEEHQRKRYETAAGTAYSIS